MRQLAIEKIGSSVHAARRMIVFLAGMPRSGSTFAFNIAREMLKSRGGVYQCDHADVAAALCAAGPAVNILLKAHVIDRLCVALAQRHAIVTICTVRRVEDAVASWMETFGADEGAAVEGMRAWLALYRQIRPFALTVPYALIDNKPRRAIWPIARHVRQTPVWWKCSVRMPNTARPR